MVQQSATTVAGGVAAGDELRQSFGGEFFAAEGGAGVVFALLEAGEEVNALVLRVGGGGVETVFYAGCGYAGEIFDGANAFGEERV